MVSLGIDADLRERGGGHGVIIPSVGVNAFNKEARCRARGKV